MAGYNLNFTPWQSFSSANPGGLATPTFQGLGTSPDQELLAQQYDAQQNVTALNKAARLKHLRDLNMQLARMGVSNGQGADAAVNMAERPGAMFNPNPTGGFSAPGSAGYPSALPWVPPVPWNQRQAPANPAYAVPTVDPYPRWGQTGSPQGAGQPPSGPVGNPGMPGIMPTQRSNYLNNLESQVAQDGAAAFRASLYTPLEPYLSPFDKQLALAEAKGGSARPPSYVNAGANANAQAQGAPRGTTPTANATLTDQRVRQENDTRQATNLILAGGIKTMADLQDKFPDADWNRLGALLKSQQEGASGDYQSAQRYAEQANQALDAAAQDAAQKQADLEYSKGLQGLHFWQSAQPLKDQYNDTVLTQEGVNYTPDLKTITAQEKAGQGLIQYDPETGTFVPTVKPISQDPAFQPGYISRQDMPGQNFHTDLPRSPIFSGLPIARTYQEAATLPPGAQYVDGVGQIHTVPGGPVGGPRYGQPRARSQAGYVPATPAVDPNARVNFGGGTESPVGNYVGFGGNTPDQYHPVRQVSNIPRAADGTPMVRSEEDLQFIHGWFIDPNGTRRWKP